eukprot:5856817-Pyramimonas_sp.AAC.2
MTTAEGYIVMRLYKTCPRALGRIRAALSSSMSVAEVSALGEQQRGGEGTSRRDLGDPVGSQVAGVGGWTFGASRYNIVYLWVSAVFHRTHVDIMRSIAATWVPSGSAGLSGWLLGCHLQTCARVKAATACETYHPDTTSLRVYTSATDTYN